MSQMRDMGHPSPRLNFFHDQLIFVFCSPILAAMRRIVPLSAGALRVEIAVRNLRRGRLYPHEATYGRVPSVVFQEHAEGHGNFLEESYRAILAEPEWAERLGKRYTADCRVPRQWDRRRCELDCANSSDALLMNVFCYPEILSHWPLCGLLGVERGVRPVFGYKPRTPYRERLADATEVDMRLGTLLVEAKLTEGSFQTAALERVLRYRDFEEVFDLDEVPVREGVRGMTVDSYQLIRGVLAARHCGGAFAVMCDGRRADLVEKWFKVIRAVRRSEMRSRLALVTWQEIAGTLPERLRLFLAEKYGIEAS